MMEIRIDYPTAAQEEEILSMTTSGELQLPEQSFGREDFLQLRNLVLAVPLPKSVSSYIVNLCGSSRPGDQRASQHAGEYIAWGAGPRGSQNLAWAAKASALLDGRSAPTVEDVRRVVLPVLRHRIIPNHRAVGDGVTSEHIVGQLLEHVQV